MSTSSPRMADHPVEPIFLERWSPRAFDGKPVPHAALMSMFEAARWAPSSYNSQPWRFLYAVRDTPNWQRFLDLLVPFNQSWAKSAGALICIVSKSTMVAPGSESETVSHSHSFDTGAASFALAMQAHALGLASHAMVGVDFTRASETLGIPAFCRVEAMTAVGERGNPDDLPEGLRAREQPSLRRTIAEFAFEGEFPPALR